MSGLPSVFVLGAGRVGVALAKRWQRAGVVLTGAWSRSPAGARRAQRQLGIPVGHGPDLPSSIGVAEVLLVSVPDDALAPLSGRLVWDVPMIHCAGALDASVLPSTVPRASLHPLQTVPDVGEAGTTALEGAYAVIEGDDVAVNLAKTLATAAGLSAVSIPSGAKARYHAAAVLACNHLVALLHLATEQLVTLGLAAPVAREMLTPLVEATVANACTRSAEEILTGPIRRGDSETVRRHLSALEGTGHAESVYRSLSLVALELAAAVAAPADQASLDAIAELLEADG